MKNGMMKALVYEGPRVMNLREVPVPVPKDDEVLIRVGKAGICGSELSGYLGQNSLRKPPLVMGHEFAGTVEAVGPAVTRFAPGTLVTANPLVTCGACRHCRSGAPQLCLERSLVGAHRPGAFAEYVAVPERNVYALPPGMTAAQGALVEPFACGVHLCRLAGMSPGHRVVVYGAGPIGLCIVQAAKVRGVRDLFVVDLNERRLEAAAALGAATGTALKEEDAGAFDIAVDAVGARATRHGCVRAVRRGGTVVWTGLHEAETELPINDMIRSEIATVGAFGYAAEDFETSLRLLGEGVFDLLPWTEYAPLADGAACFETLLTGPGRIAKIMLEV